MAVVEQAAPRALGSDRHLQRDLKATASCLTSLKWVCLSIMMSCVYQEPLDKWELPEAVSKCLII